LTEQTRPKEEDGDAHRGKHQQKVTMEHVHVHEAGQAIVGRGETPGGVRLDSECLDLRIELCWRSIMDENRDTLMRMAAFEQVRSLNEVHNHLTANELNAASAFPSSISFRIPAELMNPDRAWTIFFSSARLATPSANSRLQIDFVLPIGRRALANLHFPPPRLVCVPDRRSQNAQIAARWPPALQNPVSGRNCLTVCGPQLHFWRSGRAFTARCRDKSASVADQQPRPPVDGTPTVATGNLFVGWNCARLLLFLAARMRRLGGDTIIGGSLPPERSAPRAQLWRSASDWTKAGALRRIKINVTFLVAKKSTEAG
jgi:hypothetical protein